MGASSVSAVSAAKFPFLLGGTFIEAQMIPGIRNSELNFPSFWEGLSLRPGRVLRYLAVLPGISLPFGRDFH